LVEFRGEKGWEGEAGEGRGGSDGEDVKGEKYKVDMDFKEVAHWFFTHRLSRDFNLAGVV